jgi:hypothetical protein
MKGHDLYKGIMAQAANYGTKCQMLLVYPSVGINNPSQNSKRAEILP